MKNLVLLFALVFGLSLTASAQCSKGMAASGEKKACCASKSAALKTAMTTQGVEQKVCEKSGTVSYFQKDASGTAVAVSYDEKAGKFVSTPDAQGEKPASCSKASEKKACCASKASCSKKTAEAEVAPAIKTSM